jgi:Asp-tRNA(Asn)/Glu-tRNA(Gln) amidotransferase A subunit family amidase
MLNEIVEFDALVMRYFKQTGAILLVKGNIPQSTLGIHSENFIYGEA